MTETDPKTTRRRCTATSKVTGERCGSTPPPGGTVCKWHGGAAPQVKAKVEERIALMVDPALVALRHLVDTADSDSVRLSAIKDILDRAGYKPRDKTDLKVEGGLAIYLPERKPVD